VSPADCSPLGPAVRVAAAAGCAVLAQSAAAAAPAAARTVRANALTGNVHRVRLGGLSR